MFIPPTVTDFTTVNKMNTRKQLQEKDLEKGPGQKGTAPFFPPGFVAMVFGFTPVPYADMQHQPCAPYHYEEKDKQGPGLACSLDQGCGERCTYKPAAPGNIGNIVPVLNQRNDKPGQGIDENYQGLDEKYLQHSIC